MNLALDNYASTMARYNQWMNKNLYEVVARLADDQRKADCGLFFDSIHGTLNHLLVCDLMWMARFKGEPMPVKSLYEELYSDFLVLERARIQQHIASSAETLGLVLTHG